MHPAASDLCPWPPLKLGWHFDWPWPVLLAFTWMSGIQPWDPNSGAPFLQQVVHILVQTSQPRLLSCPLHLVTFQGGTEIKTFSASNPNIITLVIHAEHRFSVCVCAVCMHIGVSVFVCVCLCTVHLLVYLCVCICICVL